MDQVMRIPDVRPQRHGQDPGQGRRILSGPCGSVLVTGAQEPHQSPLECLLNLTRQYSDVVLYETLTGLRTYSITPIPSRTLCTIATTRGPRCSRWR